MIVGVDVSSRRVDLAWLEDGKPQRWHQELAKGHLIDRLRSIDIRWPQAFVRSTRDDIGHYEDVTDIAIELPFARQRNAVAALMAVTGIVTRQAPPWARVAWPSSGELRAAIGARNNKLSARLAIGGIGDAFEQACWEFDEHELDALVACIGWTRILEAQDAA